MKIADLEGTRWTGAAELWLDPMGDEVSRSACTLIIADNMVRYTWQHEEVQHEGSIALGESADSAASFVDSFHQTKAMQCRRLGDVGGLFQVCGNYGADMEWGWRIALCYRAPTHELILQMTNIAPWGEEARAVRMTCRRD